MAPDDGRFGPGHDDQTLARLRGRTQELRDAHWMSFICMRGHVTEVHRAAGGNSMQARCPICGAPSGKEAAEVTALREYRLENAPMALLARAYDALQDWAQQHLDARSWSARSAEDRKAALLRGDYQERRPDNLFKNPFTRG